MIKKEEVISFVWQHILLLVSLYVMTFGVAACVRSQLGSSVISTIPYVMASAGKMLDSIPGWTIGGYTIMMNAIFVLTACHVPHSVQTSSDFFFMLPLLSWHTR